MDAGAVLMSVQTHVNGGAPTWGELVERWAEEHLGLRIVDGTNYDARTSDGTPVQIKGCQRWTANGYEPDGTPKRTRGRFRLWETPLVHLLADDGLYLLVLYDEEADPESGEFVERFAFKEPVDVGQLAKGKWSPGHRPGKGKQAKLPWPEVFDVER